MIDLILLAEHHYGHMDTTEVPLQQYERLPLTIEDH